MRGRITLYEVPAHLRSKGAERARKSLRDMLNHPSLTPTQEAHIFARLAWVDQWERLDIEQILPKDGSVEVNVDMSWDQKDEVPTKDLKVRSALVSLSPRAPQNHTVELAEALTVSQDMSQPTKE